MTITATSNPFARTVPFMMERHAWGEHRKANISMVSVVKTSDDQEETDKTLLSLRKRLIDSEKTRAIRNLDLKFRVWVESVSSTPLRPGLFLVPVGMVEQVSERAEAWEKEREALVAEAKAEFPSLIAPMKAKLGAMWNERDYPTADKFAESFWVEWRFVDMGVPNMLRDLRADVFAKERKKVEREAERAAEMIRQHLRSTLLDITTHVVGLLEPREGGRKARLTIGALDRMNQFFETIALRDVTGDTELRAISERLQRAARGIDVEVLRSDDVARARTKEAFDGIAAVLAPMVDTSTRLIRFRETTFA